MWSSGGCALFLCQLCLYFDKFPQPDLIWGMKGCSSVLTTPRPRFINRRSGVDAFSPPNLHPHKRVTFNLQLVFPLEKISHYEKTVRILSPPLFPSNLPTRLIPAFYQRRVHLWQLGAPIKNLMRTKLLEMPMKNNKLVNFPMKTPPSSKYSYTKLRNHCRWPITEKLDS